MASGPEPSDGSTARPAAGDGSRLARIERALRELPLSEEQIATAAPALADDFLLRDGKVRDDSSLFDFRRKVTAVAEHFQEHGLTLPDYLHAAVNQPQLFYQSPATLIGNIEGVVSRFEPDGLTLPAYLRAAVKQG
jgi:hypothetical protein